MSARSAHAAQATTGWAAPEPSDGCRLCAFIASSVHRCFFTAGILVVLTAGAAWGAFLLWQIGSARSFTGISIHQINAHGHAQIFGWVGLFVLGVCYRLLPHLWSVPLAAPGLVPPVFLAMIAGLTLSVLGEAGSGVWPSARAAAGAGGLLEIAAVIVFATQIGLTFSRGRSGLAPWSGFVLAGVGWFVLMSCLSAWYTNATLAAGSREELLAYVSTYQAVLRNTQIHGLALFMVLGMSLRLLPEFFGVPRTTDRRAWWGLGLLLAATAIESLSLLAFRATGEHALAGLMYGAWILFPTAVAIIALPWRLWRPFPRPDRSAKFVRTAYAWLAISFSLMLLLPLYQHASGLAFSHAYYGAIRHAITVGFISLMILGMASRLVPLLRGIPTPALPPLWGPFLLVNIGCLTRVTMQILTDWHEAPFGIIGFSGILELSGIAWWGGHLVGLLYRQNPSVTRPLGVSGSGTVGTRDDRARHALGSLSA